MARLMSTMVPVMTISRKADTNPNLPSMRSIGHRVTGSISINKQNEKDSDLSDKNVFGRLKVIPEVSPVVSNLSPPRTSMVQDAGIQGPISFNTLKHRMLNLRSILNLISAQIGAKFNSGSFPNLVRDTSEQAA